MHRPTFKKLTLLLTSATLLSAPFVNFSQPEIAEAAIFTQTEKSLINKLQTDYEMLDKTPYSSVNLYAAPPVLGAPFKPGQLSINYINAQMAYINYYRSLFDLGPIISTQEDNDAAQTTAAIMATMQASPFVDQHGLPTLTKPDFINEVDWLTAKQVSSSSNLNFNTYNESPGDVITDFIKDSNNLSGADTGHRAWLLSTRLSQTGLGAAYGANGYRYSVQMVMYGNDIFKAPTRNTIGYPSTGVFPIELLQGGAIPWSFYISNQKVKGTPVITIRDLDTNQVVQATGVGNYSNNGYGNFNTVLSYYPSNLNIVSGHQYRVTIQGVTTYTFKLYNQVRANQPPYQVPTTQAPQVTQPNVKTPVVETALPKRPEQIVVDKLTKDAEALRDTLMRNRTYEPTVFGRSYQDGKKFINLGSNQWYQNFYHYSNPEIEAGVVSIKADTIDREIYTGPYVNKQTASNTYLPIGSYAYGQKIEQDNYTWYYLGPNRWIHQKTLKPKLTI